ncbi:MAG TPA: shikimate dehydrogenase [Nevskiaceae bacterium]|nr:shikimate dehydrogenase [Nevskiaceae bacterium]
MTDQYAVIGCPISHRKSPVIHARFAAQVGAQLSYIAIEIRPDALAARLAELHAQNFLGLNVTLPHKTAVAAICNNVSERAQVAGAVNTLVRTAGGWDGDNTDGEGLIRDLTVNLGIGVAGKRVLVLGAGGAARGILKPLLDQQPAELTLSNRNPWKPEELAIAFRPHGVIRPATHLALKGDHYDLVINATSAGHQGKLPKLPPQLLAPGAACYDMSYGAAAEPFCAWARANGAAKVSDGLGMLVEQAAASFERWRGVRPQAAPVIAELRAAAIAAEPAQDDGKPREAATHRVHGEDCGRPAAAG